MTIGLKYNPLKSLGEFVNYLCHMYDLGDKNRECAALKRCYLEGETAIALCTSAKDLYNAETKIITEMSAYSTQLSYDLHMSKLLFQVSMKQAEILKS